MSKKSRYHLAMAQSEANTQRGFVDEYQKELRKLKSLLKAIQKAQTLEEAIVLAKSGLL